LRHLKKTVSLQKSKTWQSWGSCSSRWQPGKTKSAIFSRPSIHACIFQKSGTTKIQARCFHLSKLSTTSRILFWQVPGRPTFWEMRISPGPQVLTPYMISKSLTFSRDSNKMLTNTKTCQRPRIRALIRKWKILPSALKLCKLC
jgi:hypothetical protein